MTPICLGQPSVIRNEHISRFPTFRIFARSASIGKCFTLPKITTSGKRARCNTSVAKLRKSHSTNSYLNRFSPSLHKITLKLTITRLHLPKINSRHRQDFRDSKKHFLEIVILYQGHYQMFIKMQIEFRSYPAKSHRSLVCQCSGQKTGSN